MNGTKSIKIKSGNSNDDGGSEVSVEFTEKEIKRELKKSISHSIVEGEVSDTLISSQSVQAALCTAGVACRYDLNIACY
jgi:hypothetical protein